MAFAIIRNSKYKRKELNLIYRHNERKNTNYSNTNIDRNKSYLNYSLKKCYSPYTTSFNEIRKKYEKIAKELGISRSYVSRIEKRALTKMLKEFIKNNNS